MFIIVCELFYEVLKPANVKPYSSASRAISALLDTGISMKISGWFINAWRVYKMISSTKSTLELIVFKLGYVLSIPN